MKKIDPKVKALDATYAFYQYQDDQHRPLLGQYFAVITGSRRPSTNGTFVYDAIVKKVDRPNPDVEAGLQNSAFLLSKLRVDATTAQEQHPKLIDYILSSNIKKALSS